MDLRYALRSLRKNPGFTLLAVLVMALGIGANTAVFSVVNSVLLKPLDYPEPDRIVTVSSLWKASGNRGQASGPDFHDWHDQNTTFSAMSYYYDMDIAVNTGGVAEYGHVAAVMPEFFEVFDVRPVVGRSFVAEDQKHGGPGVAMISYGFWRSHFGGTPAALGQTVRIFGKAMPVVGVLPAGFQFPNKADVWYPAGTLERETASRSAHNYLVIGRLKPGVTLAEAQSQMTAIGSRLEQQYPASNQGKNVAVTRLRDAIVGDFRATLLTLLGAVALVLLIACANMANLLLAKATGRTREIAIRAAVGAGRGRIVRLLLTESLVLALASGVAGLVLALWGSSALVAIAPRNVPRLEGTAIDGWVLAFTFAVSVVSTVLFGLTPALQASRLDLNDALKRGMTRSTGSAAGRIRSALVVAEIALSVVLLASAGLLMKSFIALHNVALGFRPENILVMQASVPAGNIEAARRASRFYEELLAYASSLPGVSAAGASRLPPGRILSNGGYWLDHLPGLEGLNVSGPQAVFSIVTPGAFAALGIPLRAGRDFNPRDTYDAPFTAIINEALARKSFPGQDPLGHVIFCGFDSLKPMQIVGVVGDIRQGGPASPPRPEIYMPNLQHPGGGTSMSVMVKTVSEPVALSEALRRKAREISPEAPVKFTTMEASLAENVATPRFRTLLFGIFAGLAVCLAMAGVYGVMAYSVGQRVNEIGLRIALGATPGRVMRLVLRHGLTLAAVGLAIGLAGSFAATRLLTKMLFEVKPTDPMTYVAVAGLLGAVALLATYIPARRAMKVDPLMALRQD
jgi:putative ABC transport system permease protein